MRTSTRIIRNSFYLSFAQITNPLLSMILVLIMSRRTGAAGLGIYTTVLTLFSFFTLLSVLGLNEIIIRDIAADKSKVGLFFTNALFLAVVSAILFCGIMILTTKILGYSSDIFKAVLVMGLPLLFFTVSSYSQAILQAFERMEYCAIILVSETLWKVIPGTFVLLAGYSIFWVIVVVAISHLFSMIIGLFLIHRYVAKLNAKIDWNFLRNLLKQVPTFLSLSVVVMVYWSIDILMLSKMKGVTDVGYYSAAYRLLTIGKGLTNCYIMAIFPVISHFYIHSKNSFVISCTRSIKYLLILVLPITIIITIFAGDILFLLYGKGFEQATSTLQVLVWTGVLFPIANIFGNALIASHRQKIDLWVNSIGAVFNISLNLILIPRYSHFGAGLATLISILFFIIVQYYFVTKMLFNIHFPDIIFKPFLSALSMTIAILLLKNFNLPLAILTGLLFYVVVLIISKNISHEELGQFKNVWKEKKLLFLIGK